MTLSLVASALPYLLVLVWMRFPSPDLMASMEAQRLQNLHQGLHRPTLMVIGLVFAVVSAFSTVAELTTGRSTWWIPALGTLGWVLHEVFRRQAVARVDAYVEGRPRA